MLDRLLEVFARHFPTDKRPHAYTFDTFARCALDEKCCETGLHSGTPGCGAQRSARCALAGDGFVAGTAIVFRAKALEVTPGRRYFVEVSIDGGKTLAHRYVFEFCAAVAESAAK